MLFKRAACISKHDPIVILTIFDCVGLDKHFSWPTSLDGDAPELEPRQLRVVVVHGRVAIEHLPGRLDVPGCFVNLKMKF